MEKCIDTCQINEGQQEWVSKLEHFVLLPEESNANTAFYI